MKHTTAVLLLLAAVTVTANKQNFCKPLLDYTPRIDRPQPRTVCSTVMRHIVEEVTEAGCLDVVSLDCNVVLVPECTTTVTEVDVATPESMVGTVNATLKTCTKTSVLEMHEKEVFECRNVTKTHCTTLWRLNEAGEKEWAGNEDDCKEVAWEECKPVFKSVPFPTPAMTCDDLNVLYNDVMDVPAPKMNVTSTECTVTPQQVCTPQPAKKCSVVTYTKMSQVPVTQCKEVELVVPTQDEVHKQWCLFDQTEETIDFDQEVKHILETQDVVDEE